MTETKCATETVVAAEFHPLEAGVIVSVGKGHVNFWTLDNTTLTLSRKTGLFDLRCLNRADGRAHRQGRYVLLRRRPARVC